MMQLNNCTISTKDGKKIVQNLSFILNENDKLAIIGEEGNGKSTILKFMYDTNLIDDYCYYSGNINISMENIGYLPQTFNKEFLHLGAMDYLILDEINNEPNYEVYNIIFKIEKLFDEYELDLEIIHQNRCIETLSGGEKIKLQLVKLMTKNAHLFILDEPTNDLDLDTIILLEEFIKNTKTPIIYISHDEILLRNTANKILHIEQLGRRKELRFTYEAVGYDEYLYLRDRKQTKQNLEAYRTHKEYKRKQEILARQHALVQGHLNMAIKDPSSGRILAKKMANIKSQERKLEKMEVTDYVINESEINVFFNEDINFPLGKTLLDIKNYTLKVEDHILSNNINLFIKGNKHIAIIGKNGCGKTTLINEIYKMLLNNNINVGYMPQDYTLLINDELKPVEYLQSLLGYDNEIKAKIMSHLGALGFIEYEMNKSIKCLSGGQKAKLYLLKLIMLNNNVLILDEPTRNLSVLSVGVVKRILKTFNGAIIFISHDRAFINDLADEVYELTNDGLRLVK